jgi:hypothetical protein
LFDLTVRVRIEGGVDRAVRFSRAMRLRTTAAPPLGESVVKEPPIRIFPPGCMTTTLTAPFAFDRNRRRIARALPPRRSQATRKRKTVTAVNIVSKKN